MSALDTLSVEKRLLLQKQLSSAGRNVWARPIPRREGDAHPPIAGEQMNIWLHAAMAPRMPLYNEAVTLHYRGSLDREALTGSVRTFIRRHEAWRTSFAEVDGMLRQIVHPDPALEIPLSDLTSFPEKERDERARTLAGEDARKPFDLSSAPLLRARLVRLEPDYHRLYLTLHHIIFDGVTIYRIFLPELGKIYAALSAGRTPDLPPPRLQYGDYAVWRTRRLEEDSMAREIAYWRRQLSGDLPDLRLPTDRPRPAHPTYAGSMETFTLGHARTTAAKAFARRQGVTLYVVLLAAFKAMLYRYSGQDDIVIGGVTDTRRRPELADVAGNFLNSLPLRTHPTGDLSFRDFLQQVQKTVVGALDASDLPFDRIVREARIKRDGRHPLFQTLFSVEPPAPPAQPGWDLTQMDVTVGAAKFDLYLELDERPEGLIGRFLYSTELFDATTIRRMIGHWIALLDGALADPQCTIGHLPLLAPQERQLLLHDVNATGRAYDLATVPELFEAQARKTPERAAVLHSGQAVSYRALMQRVCELTDGLRSAGVGHNDLVGLMLERSPDLVASLIAIMRCGAVYLPLDPHLPERRLAMLLEDARPAFLLTHSSLCERVPENGNTATILCADKVTNLSAGGAASQCNLDDAAYILYTSGSTGKPKAVEICHRSLANLLAAIQEHVNIGPGDTLLAVTTISFDIAALEIFLPLVTGSTILLAAQDEVRNPEKLIPLLRRTAVMQATPATWRSLIAAGWTGSPNLKILCGGEALSRDLASQLLARAHDVWNVYGPTETTIWSTIHKVRPEDGAVPIGRPLANTTIHVLDRHGEPVPLGVTGELYIGGAGVARGYRHATQLTNEKFCILPGSEPQRVYRTGDLVHFRNDGTLAFAGRSDNQVKIRGFRVGLEEVDTAIASHPAIAAAAVAAFPDASGELSLAAFVVQRAGTICDDSTLKDFLRGILPAYMVPARIVTLASLPVTASGKLDRKQLAAPGALQHRASAEPRHASEQALADLWKQFLNVQDIGRDDDFFELGGHSLLGAMLMGRINKAMNCDLPLSALFRAPTIAGLAKLLRAGERPKFSHLVPFRTAGSGRPLFMVHGIFGNVLQLRALADRMNTSRPIYALQASGADPQQQLQPTIAEMARTYIEAIRSVQPSGPYALAGYSFGGLIAYEMACLLREAGEDVDLLALLETEVHRRNLKLAERAFHHAERLGRAMRSLSEMPIRRWMPYLAGKAVEIVQPLFGREYITELDNTAALPEAVLLRNREMYAAYEKEFRAYRLRPYAGKVTLFLTPHAAFHVYDPRAVCRRMAKAVDIVSISGTHDTIMDGSNVEGLAQQLSRCLADCPNTDGFKAAHSPDRPRYLEREIEAT